MHTLSFLSGLALFVDAIAAGTTLSQIKCTTKVGPQSTSSVHTTTLALTIPLYFYQVTTLTPQATITPAATTTTISTTTTQTVVTTQTQLTDTFSTTSTVSVTNTITATETDSTTTTYTTTSTSTPSTTVPASAGFIPIQSSIPNSAQKRDADVLEDAHAVEERAAASSTKPYHLYMQQGHMTCSPAAYPTAVTCAGLVEVISTSTITKTATTTHTNTASTPTSSTTTTITQIVTSTVTPIDASTTLSFTDTSTVSSTTTSTTTTTFSQTATVGAVAPTSTFYAACSANNIITTYQGEFIEASYILASSYTYNSASTAYDCCVTCITTTGCAGTYGAPEGCYLAMGQGTCTQNGPAFGLVFGSSNYGIYASNGYCGQDSVYSS